MKKKIIFTFDYELFLGANSGSVQKCMIEPTNRLIQVFEEFDYTACIFFIDTTYLLRLKAIMQEHEAAKNDYHAIEQQLQNLIRKGHLIYPHIHPHWLDAQYIPDQNRWQLNELRYYRFHAISEEKRTELFSQSVQLLNGIARTVDPAYQCEAYRAGGWCIQPFSDFEPHFRAHGIQSDFSVLPGIRNLSNAQYYDFEQAPESPIYRFEKDVIRTEANGSFYQYAISVLHVPGFIAFLNRFLLKILWKTGNRSIGDGNGVVAKQEAESVPQKTNLEMVSIELLTAVKLPLYKQFLAKHNYMQFISHPKMLAPHNFSCLRNFLKDARKHYSIEGDFRKIRGEF